MVAMPQVAHCSLACCHGFCGSQPFQVAWILLCWGQGHPLKACGLCKHPDFLDRATASHLSYSDLDGYSRVREDSLHPIT